MGTATNNRRLNRPFLSSSFPQEPRIRLPPEENGLMALDCAPRTVQAKSTAGFSPVDTARAGISGNRAGATTPVVELKKLMNAATRLKAMGTRATGTLEPIHADRASTVSYTHLTLPTT